MNRTLEHILPRVQKPARYTGGEYNAVVKDRRAVDVRYALCFPDTYEIGMSNLGVRILYGLMNEMDGVWCERVFAPWGDMEEEMRREGIPLYGLESGDSIADFDLIGFSLGYEMAYTNVLNMLDLAGLPLRSGERTELSPIVVAGGTCAFNPEPLAPFVDLFVLGEGEDVSVEIIQLYRQAREEGWGKEEFLTAAARIPGVYVPSLYEVSYHGDGTVAAVTPLEGAPARVTKRIVQDFDKSYFPVKTIVPSTEIVHDRVMLEVFRGCIRGCRFCQAGYAYRPVRPRNPQRLVQQGIEACRDSGYQEMTLSSLSTSDYRALEGLCDGLLEWCEPNKVSLSLPSLRADNFSLGLMERVQHVRKSGLTFAPEAGTQRLRDAINKNVTEEEILRSCRTAFSGGWSSVKLYFMLGLPTETPDDVRGIVELAQRVVDLYYRTEGRAKGQSVNVTVSVSTFVPKPFTPFQYEPQDTFEQIEEKHQILRESVTSKKISLKYHHSDASVLEAVFARGDRRLGEVMYRAFKKGCKFDSWDDQFHYDRWLEAFKESGLDPSFYANRRRSFDEILPWSHMDYCVSERFLQRENERAHSAVTTKNCRQACAGCGANCLLTGGKCFD